jgi:hypothetical protein
MLKTVSAYKDSVSSILSGLNMSSVSDLNATLERAARTLVQKADIPEASGIQNITLYSGVFDYECDTTIFGTAVTDVRPQGISRPSWDTTTKTTQQQFDRFKAYRPNGTTTTFQYENGVPIIRIKAPFSNQGAVLDPCTQVGNWVAGGTASGLVQDTSVYYQAPASLRFSLTTGAGTLTNALSFSDSLSSYEDVGVAFLAVYIPSNVSNLTSISLKIGSDASNYNQVTSTTPFIGNFTNNLWQLVSFDFSTASQTGTPDWSAIDYIQVTFNTTGSITNARIGDLFISQPTPAQILYQSAAIFLPTGSTTALTTITANTDTIILNDPAYNIYLYEGALAILENMSGGKGDSMYERINSKLNGDGTDKNIGLYGLFRGDNPSQELRTTSSWYETNQGGSAGYGNIGYVY